MWLPCGVIYLLKIDRCESTGFGEISCEGCIPDTVNGAKYIRDLYEMANDQSGTPRVPSSLPSYLSYKGTPMVHQWEK